jgi:hypothetical protein
MLKSILESIFGCAHRTTTFPLTPRRKRNTYVVCLDCGREFGYDWNAMRIGEPVPASHATMIPATK